MLTYVVYEVKGSKKNYVGKKSAEEIEYSCRKQQTTKEANFRKQLTYRSDQYSASIKIRPTVKII